ncbi:unnamed protein product [Adineta ricciae]|uniref:Uncharacterized protein n=1 Tax=Adineta ricciae TaxID=249248 RepID=A0A815PWU5_ADIRI|nr:unnamed protein product [Adineta ricciae]CAF1455448.1 unnamed protein product [Adineta ricciae]
MIPGFEVHFEPNDGEDEHDDETDSADYEGNGQEGHLNDEEEHLRMQCFCHTLQLTVGGGLQECKTNSCQSCSNRKTQELSTSYTLLNNLLHNVGLCRTLLSSLLE